MGQFDGLAPQVAADAVQLSAAVQLVGLQELAHVVFINTKCGNLNGIDIDCLKGDAEKFILGQNDALAGEAHPRFLAHEKHLAGFTAAQLAALAAFDRGIDGNADFPGQVAVRVYLDPVVLNLGVVVTPAQGDQPAQVLALIEFVGKGDLDVLAVRLYGPDPGQLENTGGGDFHLAFTAVLHADAVAVPA